jgi:hypothetical protein
MEHIQPDPKPRDPRIQPPPLVQPAAAAPEPPPRALPAASFPSARYAPDGGCPVGGFFALLWLALLAGALIGGLGGLLHLVFWFPLVFAGLVGGGVGAVAAGAVVLGQVRNRLVAGLVGLFAGLVAYVAVHFTQYVASGALANGLSFGGYVNAVARHGVTISDGRSTSKPWNLGYTGSYIYWLLELGIAGAIAAGIPAARAGKPFCDACGSWKTSHKLGVLFLDREAAKVYLEGGELGRLADPNEPPGEGPLTLSAWWCPHCLDAAPVEAELQQTIQKKKGVKVMNLGCRTFPGAALPVLRALCDRRGDPSVPPALR